MTQFGENNTMATRVNAIDEKIATLQSIMNVISLVKHADGPGAGPERSIDLRPLLTIAQDNSAESWHLTPSHLASVVAERRR
jgi:hypothetical protein